MALNAARDGDVGAGDLIVSDIIRPNETQVWFVVEHRTATPAEVE